MTFADVLRLLAVGLFASVLAQATVVLFHVHRSRQTGPIRVPRLLAWHVYAVTAYALGMHATLLGISAQRLGEPDIQHPAALTALILLGLVGNVAMHIIGRVTSARRRLQSAAH